MLFRNREEAARLLIGPLERFRSERVVVLSIPRGGVPMGCAVARHFGWEHGFLLTKKIGHPTNPEYAIGAVGSSMVYVDEKQTDIPQSYLESEIARIRTSITQREKRFLQGQSQPSIEGKAVIIIDDGIATGLTMRVSVLMLRRQNPKKIIVAAPVAPPSSVKMIRQVADEVVVLQTPSDFSSVGEFYEDFSEVTDEEVMRLMGHSVTNGSGGQVASP